MALDEDAQAHGVLILNSNAQGKKLTIFSCQFYCVHICIPDHHMDNMQRTIIRCKVIKEPTRSTLNNLIYFKHQHNNDNVNVFH